MRINEFANLELPKNLNLKLSLSRTLKSNVSMTALWVIPFITNLLMWRAVFFSPENVVYSTFLKCFYLSTMVIYNKSSRTCLNVLKIEIDLKMSKDLNLKI